MEEPTTKVLMLALRQKQAEVHQSLRTCKPEQLIRFQAQDQLLEFIFDPSFAEYVSEAFDREKDKQAEWKKNIK